MGRLSQEVIFVIGIAVAFLIVSVGVISLVIIYRNKQMQSIRDSERMKASFDQQLLQSQLETQEQTFNTISREIHDNVGQVLSLAKVQLNIIEQGKMLDMEMLTEAKESVSKAMTDLRDIAKSLNSDRIKFSGLLEITEYELQRISRSGIKQTSIKVEGNERSIKEGKKLIIFRILQEAFHNILKHSGAQKIDVIFSYTEYQLEIVVVDDGIGFDNTVISKKDGLGLQNIVNRAALIEGKAIIDSTPNKGTVIKIIVPYA